MALVRYEELGSHAGKIVLNDPQNLNAMGEEMAREFRALVEGLQPKVSKLRALVLTGEGRAFSAGGNLVMLERKTTLSGEENRLRMLDFYHSFLSLLSLRVPLIAAINGHAIGAGLCVASACDLRIAAKGSKLGFTFVKLGLHPGMGATYFLPRILGTAKANELLLTGRVLDADGALAAGLVSKVVEPDQLGAEVDKLVAEIAEGGPESVRQLVESLRGGSSGLEAALEREALCQAVNYGSAEFKQGVRAAIEKRKPSF
jgi:enoyl-CoA hydratase